MRVGIIGAGLIGSELYRKVKALGWNVKFVLRSDGVYRDLDMKIDERGNYLDYCQDVDCVFLAIPTVDDGKIALEYMQNFLEKGIPVVTCEKGALANYFSELEKWIGNVGFNATVGGGTRMLEFVQKMDVKEIYAVVNGTLNFVFDEGKDFSEVVDEARKRGYTEPGATDALDVINVEAMQDVPMKAAILFNVCGLGQVRAKDIQVDRITEEDLKKIIHEKRRYCLSISKEKVVDIFGGFSHQVDDWFICGGFARNPAVTISGVDNILSVNGQQITGPGAGAGPTTDAMIYDAKK